MKEFRLVDQSQSLIGVISDLLFTMSKLGDRARLDWRGARTEAEMW